MIDTHIHIDEEAYAVDREEVIARQREAGVEAMIVPGVNAKSIEGILDVCHRHKGYCFPALGFHPQDVFPEDYKQQWAIIEHAIRAHRDEIVAIGEIGLDYHYDTTYKEGQQEIFQLQLDLAKELDLPIMIHNRDATEDTLRILKANTPLRGVVHCFNGSKEVAKQILDLGMYLGIGGVLTFKNCKLFETLEVVPLDRIVLETDGPYLAPTPHRGERNESRLMIFVVQRLAEIYQTTPEEVIKVTSENAKKLFFT
ncbi:MAG: TatD family hydrolase [Paludibacteraceae bacterium]|nr:TatD family hydrolase [Paludibacteraceae bacterium]